MTKTDLLNRKRKTKTFDHDGESYTVRKLTAGETAKIRADYQGEARVMDGMRYVFACAVVESDESPANLFDTSSADKTKASIAEISTIDYDTVQAVAMQAMEFSGINTSAAKAKND